MILPERGNCWERTDSLGQNGGMAFGKPTTVTVFTDTKPIKLQGKRFDVRELESVVFLLREEPTLRGVYRLTFATGERYVGQSVNVANRFVGSSGFRVRGCGWGVLGVALDVGVLAW